MSWSRSVAVLFVALVALFSERADAAGVLVPRDGGAPIQVRSHRVTAVVEDGIARTTVRQTFVNPHGRTLEAIYTFPIPEGASLVDLAMETGGQRLEGFLAERRTARRAYDRLTRRNVDPALVEQIGRSTFRLSVFPVLPDQPTVVELTWIEPLPVAQGEVRYVYPLALAGDTTTTQHDFTLSVTVRSSAKIAAVGSTDAAMACSLPTPHEARAALERTGAKLDRDVVVTAKLAPTEPALAVRTFRGAKGDAYFAAVVTPPDVQEDRLLARDLTLVLDVSGSMEGAKFEQAKSSAHWLLGRLRPKDRVNLLRFATVVERASDAPLPATPENVARLRAFVDESKAAGATALGDALDAACRAPVEAGRVPMVVFLTDGEPTVGEQRPEAIVEFARAGAARGLRVFTFGVGDDVRAPLLEGIASAGRGTSEVFRPQGEVESRLRRFLTRTESPVLAGLQLEIDGRAAGGLFPRPVPDVYLGEQAVLLGRIAAAGAHRFLLRAVYDAKPLELAATVQVPEGPGGAPAVRDLWASSHLDFLHRAIRLRSGLGDAAYFAALDRGAYSTQDELVQAMIQVSLETGVQCPYTSFLALLPEDRALLDPRDAAAVDEAIRRAADKRRELAGLPAPERKTADGAEPAAPRPPSNPTAAGDEAPPVPPEMRPMEESERVMEDPVLKDAKVADHEGTDDDWESDESLGDPRFNSDSPFEGLGLAGHGAGGTIGIGGGAGGAFGGRRGGHRNLRAGGTSRKTQTGVDRALFWLSARQAPDGSWSATDAGPGDAASTGLALLAFLGAGETHQSGNYKDAVRDGLKYLRDVQDTEGCFGPRTGPRWMFGHLVATTAMSEAYGMTQSVIFKDSAQRGVNFVHQCNNPYAGWGLGVRDGKSDALVTAWAVLCLRSAHLAELEVDKALFVAALKFTDDVTDPATGAVGATKRGDVPALPEDGKAAFPPATAPSLDAAGVLVRFLAKAVLGTPDASVEPQITKAAMRLVDALPADHATLAAFDAQAWLLGSLATFQVGGDEWKRWNTALQSGVVDSQRTDPTDPDAGAWNPSGPWAREGGRVQFTALMTLCLETYYRYGRVLGTR